MKIETVKEGTAVTLKVDGRVDTTTAPELEAAVNAEIGNAGDFIFDFSNLEYISSAGLRVLLHAQKVIKAPGKVTVAHANDDIIEIFSITGFTDILNIEK